MNPITRQRRSNIDMLAARLLELKRTAEAENNFRAFVKLAWPIVTPDVQFVDGWHIGAICEHLEAVSRCQIRQLVINMPPRCAKSTLAAVMWPAWVWITRPAIRWLYASYSHQLSLRDSKACRNLIRSTWYQKLWNTRFSLVAGQNQQARFDNDRMGYRLATSVGGSNTGEGGDIIVYDDPNNVKDVSSDALREEVNFWHDSVMSSRLNNPKTGCRVIIQQRSHERDLSGHVLEKGDWEHLVLPMEYEGPRSTTSIGWTDKRTNLTELLWPEQFDESSVAKLKRDLGASAAGQLQQRPAASAGEMFKRHNWQFWNPPKAECKPINLLIPGGQLVEKIPVNRTDSFEQVVQSWDMAFKDEKSNDFVAGHVWGRVGANFYLLDRICKRMDFVNTLRAVREMSLDWPCPEKLVEARANGTAVISTLQNEIPGLIPVEPQGGKIARAASVTPYCDSGNVFLPNPELYPWVNDFIDTCANFPKAKHDDDVDAMSQAIRHLADSIANLAAPEFRVNPRVGEPQTASHICHREDLGLSAEARRWCVVIPGNPGSALWFADMPSGAIRVYRELNLGMMNAAETGRAMAEATLEDIRDLAAVRRPDGRTKQFKLEVFLEPAAFVHIESLGCWAEMLENGFFGFNSTSDVWEGREQDRALIKSALVLVQQHKLEESAWDRLRELLRFQPPGFREMDYNRDLAFRLCRTDLDGYNRYMNAVNGKVYGEWPRLKILAECKNTTSALGSVVRDTKVHNAFVRALLIGVSAVKDQKLELRASPAFVPPTQRPNFPPRFTGRTRMNGRFSQLGF